MKDFEILALAHKYGIDTNCTFGDGIRAVANALATAIDAGEEQTLRLAELTALLNALLKRV